jgi:hypothetical protein
MRSRALPLPTFRRRIARRSRARLLARHMLRLLTQGQMPLTRPELLRARSTGAPLLSRIGLMLMRAAPARRHGVDGATTLPH